MAVTAHPSANKTRPPSAPRPERPPRTGRVPRQFLLFPNLPTELRLVIWRCTFPGPRVVALRPRQKTVFPTRPGAAPRYVPWYTSPARLPAALHACHEARAECLATYSVLFGTTSSDDHDDDDEHTDPATLRMLGGVVFSPARGDVLYLGDGGGGATARLRIQGFLGAATTAGDLARVRRAALDAAALWDERRGPALAAAGAAACLSALAAAVPALEHLSVVRRDPDPLNSADAALVAPRCADGVLMSNVHKALGLLRNDADAATAAPFPDWELVDMAAAPPQRLPRSDARSCWATGPPPAPAPAACAAPVRAWRAGRRRRGTTTTTTTTTRKRHKKRGEGRGCRHARSVAPPRPPGPRRISRPGLCLRRCSRTADVGGCGQLLSRGRGLLCRSTERRAS